MEKESSYSERLRLAIKQHQEYMEEEKRTKTKYDVENDYYWEKGRLIFKGPRRKTKGRRPSLERIHTISYYGSKRRWRKEFEILFRHAHDLGCNRFIDCFGGSGILSLVVAQTGLYNYIQLNELFYYLVNYHWVLKDDGAFKMFLVYLDRAGRCNEENYVQSLEEKRKNIKNLRIRKQCRKPDAGDAAVYYCVKHHMYSGQGKIVRERKLVTDYIETLKRTHLLYKNITVTQYHYNKVMMENLNNIDSLVFLDCPYLPEVREQKKSYAIEMSTDQHRTMLENLTAGILGAKVILCGYRSQLYDNYFLRCNERYYTSWHCVKLKRSGSLKNGVEAKEHIWCNFGVSTLIDEYSDLFELVY